MCSFTLPCNLQYGYNIFATAVIFDFNIGNVIYTIINIFDI